MAIMRFKFLAFALLAVSFCSCSLRSQVQKQMNKNKVPLGYLSESRRGNCADEKKVVSVSVLNNPLDSITKVTKINSLFLPLILYYYHSVNLFINLGQKSLEQPYDQFFREKLEDESQRRGCYTVGQPDNNNYTLEIAFENTHTTSKFSSESRHTFVVVGVLHMHSSKGYPANTMMKATAVLKKNGSVVYENKYELNREQPFLQTPGIRTNGLVAKVESNMAESLSLTTKKCVESIVDDVNTFFRSNP